MLLGVQFIRDEEMGTWGEDPLTSVLLQQWTLCQTEGWAELQPGATTAAPGSFGFDDTETTKMKHTLVSSSNETHSRSTVLEIVIGLGFSVMFSFCWLWCMLTDSEHSERVNWQEGKRTRHRNGADIFTTVRYCPQHLLERPRFVYGIPTHGLPYRHVKP